MLGSPAQAHITLVYPAPRPATVTPAGTPCGYNPDPGRTTFQSLLPGSTVEGRWTEWINHPSHFRISFDDNGQDAFVDPISYTDFYTNAAVLLDNIADTAGVMQHSVIVVLPNMQCSNCTP